MSQCGLPRNRTHLYSHSLITTYLLNQDHLNKQKIGLSAVREPMQRTSNPIMADDLLFSDDLFSQPGNIRQPQGSRPCPPPSKISIKLYYLPDASVLPSTLSLSSELVKQHMEQGFGKFISIFVPIILTDQSFVTAGSVL